MIGAKDVKTALDKQKRRLDEIQKKAATEANGIVKKFSTYIEKFVERTKEAPVIEDVLFKDKSFPLESNEIELLHEALAKKLGATLGEAGYKCSIVAGTEFLIVTIRL